MPSICVDGDPTGGAMIASSSQVFVQGKKVVLVGDSVAPHGNGPHNGAVMVQGSTSFLVNGIGVVRTGDLASCGHSASSSVTNVLIG